MDIIFFHVRFVFYLSVRFNVIDLSGFGGDASSGLGCPLDVPRNLLAQTGNVCNDLLPCPSIPRLEFFGLYDLGVKLYISGLDEAIEKLARFRQ
jgi:hypothetical protein